MDVWSVLGAILAGIAINTIGRMIYNLWFHPLAHVSGPRLAAVTHRYPIYWHAVKKGHFVSYILRELHKRYGRVVRFYSDEVDIHDLDTIRTMPSLHTIPSSTRTVSSSTRLEFLALWGC